MAAEGVGALGTWLTQLVSLVRDLGDDFYIADAARNEYPQRVAVLEAKQRDLGENLERYGFREENNGSFLRIVKEAETLLQQEVAKLKGRKRKGQRGKCYPTNVTLFSRSVNASIEAAERAYRRISDYLEAKQKDDDGFRKLAENQGPWLRFSEDPRYVSRTALEKRIISLLNGEGQDGAEQHSAGTVVLLWGASGHGKSTLARNISLLCQNERSKFTKVVMLECGPKAAVSAKKIELLQMLGGGNLQYEGQDVDGKLQIHLRDPKTLVVLDDLSENQLLHSLKNLSASRSGPGAHYLVTSPLWEDFEPLRPAAVPIEDMEPAEAKKVLASHAGYENQTVPEHLQGVADEMVAKVGVSPLVMATLGARIAKLGKHRLECWTKVAKDAYHFLDSEAPVQTHGVMYEKGFLPVMKSAFSALRRAQEQLCVLMSMCRDTSVCEHALRFLYNTATPQATHKSDFLDSLAGLRSSNLVVEKGEGLLFMHSSTKRLVSEHYKDLVEETRKSLTGKQSGEKPHDSRVRDNEGSQHSGLHVDSNVVLSIIVHLYVDEDFRRQRSSSSHRVYGETEFSSGSQEIKTTTSEPIMQLLVPEANPNTEWTEELSMCTNQVLFDFVNEDRLHHDSISKLLKSNFSMIPILSFLYNVSLLEDSFWKRNDFDHTSSILSALLDIFKHAAHAGHHARVGDVLRNLSWCCQETSKAIANVPGMLPQLLDTLKNVQNSELQVSAAMAFSAFVYWGSMKGDTIMVRTMLDLPGLVSTLIDLLQMDEAPRVQEAAVHALRNLAIEDPEALWSLPTVRSGKVKSEIQDALLGGLMNCMAKSDFPLLQKYSAGTLSSLAGNQNMTLKLLNQSRSMHKLVRSRKDSSPEVKVKSAGAMNYKCWNCEYRTVRTQIAMWPGLLDGLGELLLKAESPSVQKNAAGVISQVAITIDQESLTSVVNHQIWMRNLVKLLHEYQDLDLQLHVACAFLCLTESAQGDKMRSKILNFSGLLEGFTTLLFKSQNLVLQSYAATNILIMSSWDLRITGKIQNQLGLVESSAKLPFEYQRSGPQTKSARVLWELAVKYIVGDKLGLLDNAADLLVTILDEEMQTHILMVISSLILTCDYEGKLLRRILDHPVADEIPKLLCESQSSAIQKRAAILLIDFISFGGDSQRNSIASFPGLLKRLTTLIYSSLNRYVIAMLVAELAVTKDTGILDRIITSHGLVEKLTSSLTEYQNPDLQVRVARALFSLAGGDGPERNSGTSELSELLMKLREALLQGKNASLRERVVATLTYVAFFSLEDEESDKEYLPQTIAGKNSSGFDTDPNRIQQRLFTRSYVKPFSRLAAARRDQVAGKVLVSDFINGLRGM